MVLKMVKDGTEIREGKELSANVKDGTENGNRLYRSKRR